MKLNYQFYFFIFSLTFLFWHYSLLIGSVMSLFFSLTSGVLASHMGRPVRRWQWWRWTTVTSPWPFDLGNRSETTPVQPRERRPDRRSKNEFHIYINVTKGFNNGTVLDWERGVKVLSSEQGLCVTKTNLENFNNLNYH